MSPELLTGLVGGVIGSVLGVVGTIASSYWGPRKLEEWREQRKDLQLNRPRKELLKRLLVDSRFPKGRSLETLSRVTGTSDGECRRLLIEVGARGILLQNKVEGWTLKGLDEVTKA